MTAAEFADRLNAKPSGPGSWMARCPAHDDHDPGLSITEGDDGRVLLRCHAGCDFAHICNVLGLRPTDLRPERTEKRRNGSAPQKRIVETYRYVDENGALLFEVVRFEPKDFRQRRPDGKGDHVWNLDGVRRVLYRLPEVNEAVEAQRALFVDEGEKDANALAALGLCATTCPQGAGKWRPEYNESLRGAHIVVSPDNDAPGRKHADQVARSLHGIAASVRVLELPDLPPKGDVSDWIGAGGVRSELLKLARAAPVFDPSARPALKLSEQAETAAEGRLRAIPISAVPLRRIEWLWPGRLARGEMTEICGEPGLGKSMLALEFAATLSKGTPWPDGSQPPGPVRSLILSAEDDPGTTIRPRLEAAGADLTRVHVLPVDQIVTVHDANRIGELIAEEEIGLLVLDPLSAFLPSGTDSHRDAEVRAAMVPLVMMARERGCVVVLVRHLNKTAGANAVYRGGGSIAFTALVRFGFAVGRHPDDRQRRVLCCVKNNLSAEPPSLVFEVVPVDDVARIAWRGACDLTAEQVLNRSAAETPADDATAFLLDALAEGPQPAGDIGQQALALGISTRTLARARAELRVVSRKDGRQWVISLPETKDANGETVGILDKGRMPGQECQCWHPSSGTLGTVKAASGALVGTLPASAADYEEF